MSFARFVAALVLLALAAFAPDGLAQRAPREALGEIHVSQLPPEARQTLALIRTEGPYPYAKDGAIFGNREGLLPRHKRGYYREYTVKTPGNRTRGARRIVAGQAGERYYTENHYKSFRRIRE